MAQGKFSNPRPHREEEREIEKAYRDLTRKKTHKPYEHSVTAEDVARAAQPLPTELPPEGTPRSAPDSAAEDRQIEDAFRQVTGQPVKPRRAAPAFDLFSEDADFPSDEAEDAPAGKQRPQWMTEVLSFYRENTRLVLAALCALSLMLIVCVVLLFVRSAADPYGGKILSNVYIADVNVGGMTKSDAVSALNEVFGDVYAAEDMVIDLSGTELRLTPGDSGVSFDAAGAVEEAFAYGRTGTQSERDAAYKASKTEPHYIAVLPYLNLKTGNIRKFLTDKAGAPGSTLVQSTYGLEGAEPELSTDKFDKNAPTQTLVITMGKPGVGFDPEDVYNQVLDAYSQRVFRVTVEDVETLKDPDPIDLEKIYREYCVEPVDASVDPKTGKTTPGSYGYGFDLDAAQKLLDNARFGEEIRIPMEYIEPEIADAGAFFRDTLGEYQTRYTSNDKRTDNLRIACESIDNRILNPGESLSFRDAVGQLSSAQGYKSAPEDIGMDSTVGGGVSQVSSTLYCAAILSDLSISSRSNLAQMPSFIGSGLDAAVNLTIKNTLSYPVRISAQVTGGYVRIRILGTEQRDYYRMLGSEIVQTYKAETEYKDFPYDNAEGYRDGDVLQEGQDGYQVKSYAVRYDKETDKRITSDYVATSTYEAGKRVVARVEKPAETTAPTQPEESTEPTDETVGETETQATEGKTVEPDTDADVSGASVALRKALQQNRAA